MRAIVSTAQLDQHRAAAGPSVVVPTMGALHAGHESLLRVAAGYARAHGLGDVLVTVFVNPSQFNESKDFDDYPRTLDDDLAKCEAWGATSVFAPPVSEVYPPELDVPVGELPPTAVGKGLEDEYRPGHFEGVVRVVRRLFEMCQPAAAVFGEKDWQQLCVVEQMSKREGLGVEIVPCPTARDAGGLAESSRNQHLTPEDRAAALSLSHALKAARSITDPDEAERTMREIMASAGATPEYHAIRHADTLDLLASPGERPARALVAARVGSTRLLDNMPWPA